MRLIDADKIHPDVRTQRGGLAISQGQLAYAEKVNAILIPENATNGDVFLNTFTQAEASVNDSIGERGTVFVYLGEDIIMIPLDLWIAPYKRGEEK